MNISDDTKNVIDFLDEYSQGNLRKRNHLEMIFELAASHNLHNLISDLIFEATAVFKMGTRLLRRQSETAEMERFRHEFARSSEKMQGLLAAIIKDAEESVITIFNDIYLQSTDGCMRNLIDLGHDFAIFKDMQRNSRKSK